MIDLPAYTEYLRQEVRQLRIRNGVVEEANTRKTRTIAKLKEENRVLREEKRSLIKDLDRLKKENEQLGQTIERLTITTNRYRASLFDHGNFKASLQQEKKPKGGQKGHANTNREQEEDSQKYHYQRVYASHCTDCGRTLNRVNAVKQKILLDIVLNPQVVKLIVERERQWCTHCKQAVVASHEQSLPFTEYGINTFMLALLLRYRCLLPVSKINTVFLIGFGLTISKSGLLNLFAQAKKYLGKRYGELLSLVRKGEVVYMDETGWQVKGVGAWMWIMVTPQATVYIAAESRGKHVASEIYSTSQAYAMHDGLASYINAIPNDKHLYCWSHMLRYCFEETVEKKPPHESLHIRDTLVEVYHLKRDPLYRGQPSLLESEAAYRIDRLLQSTSRDPTVVSLLHRLRQQRDGLIRALLVSPNGTNNLAEQELRPIALMRKISFGSDTFTGMETTAVLSSVVQTLVRTQPDQFFPLLKEQLLAGVGSRT